MNFFNYCRELVYKICILNEIKNKSNGKTVDVFCIKICYRYISKSSKKYKILGKSVSSPNKLRSELLSEEEEKPFSFQIKGKFNKQQ